MTRSLDTRSMNWSGCSPNEKFEYTSPVSTTRRSGCCTSISPGESVVAGVTDQTITHPEVPCDDSKAVPRSSPAAGAPGSDERSRRASREEGANVVIADLDDAGGKETVRPGRGDRRPRPPRRRRHLDRGRSAPSRHRGSRAVRAGRRPGEQRGHRTARVGRLLECARGELGPCHPDQPQERVRLLAGRDPA